MPRNKKWHEYPRVIPFDQQSCLIQQDAIYREHRMRKKWEDTYAKTVHLYRQDVFDNDTDRGKVCSSSQEDRTSFISNPPTITENRRGLMAETDQYSKEDACHKVHSTHGDDLKDEEKFRNTSPCFRSLKFPPKCDHVCARMGFECWMCDAK